MSYCTGRKPEVQEILLVSWHQTYIVLACFGFCWSCLTRPRVHQPKPAIRPVRAKVAKHSKALNYMCTAAWDVIHFVWIEHDSTNLIGLPKDMTPGIVSVSSTSRILVYAPTGDERLYCSVAPELSCQGRLCG